MTPRRSLRDQNGFTLIELLVVILILAILASIAIPTFLGQRKRGQDASAKSDARNMVSQAESCWLDGQTFVGCEAKITPSSSNLDIGPGPGQVQLLDTTDSSYRVRAISKAVTAGANHAFEILRANPGVVAHSCAPADQGGCSPNGDW